jgi:phosphatidylglycerol---prolipoprotein diacylglyceryl transferase
MIDFFPSRTIAIELFDLSIHWYGLFYAIAFLAAIWIFTRLQHYRDLKLDRDQIIEIVAWAAVGVLIGGRLGYVLFYDPFFYAANPRQIFAIWHGGMSFHGGFLGAALALWLASRKLKINALKLFDVAVIPVALGLALGRLGNFINQELYGTVTSLPWAITIPEVDGGRHPTQLYAVEKNLLILAFTYYLLRKKKNIGLPTASFLLLYGILRFAIEFVREQSLPLWLGLTRGQIYTIPIIILAIIILTKSRLNETA